ncbi:MAG: hypothetical protein IT376_01365 [Polyangiaceae bacterium]|nr:hypothetical protein [Polyangiaceae bacterium]
MHPPPPRPSPRGLAVRLGWGAAIVATVSVACGSAPAPRLAPAAAPPASSAPRPAAPETAVGRLLRALRELGRPDVMAGLSPEARADVERALAALPRDEREALATDAGPRAVARPLLHVAAGGEAAPALFALATTPAGAETLLALRRASGAPSLQDLVPSVGELARRSAEGALRELATLSGGGERLAAEECESAALAADTLGRAELVRLALDAAAEVAPTRARWLAAAQARARALDLEAAEAALREAARQPDDTSPSRPAERALELARAARRGAAGGASAAFALAALGRAADIAALEPALGAGPPLDAAAARALGALDGGTCPGLPRRVATPRLCAEAWEGSPARGPAIEALERAWPPRAPGSASAREAYVGLVHVAPWVHATARPGATGEGVLARLTALERAGAQAAEGAPELAGLPLFVEALRAGFDAARATVPGRRAALDPARRRSLSERARALAGPGAAPSAVAAVLGVASMLTADEDASPLLEGLPETLEPRLSLVRAALRAGYGVARARAPLVDAARDELGRALGTLPDGGLERAAAVLLLAEMDAAHRADPRSWELLERVATPLDREGLPLAVRLRAAIDRAGALHRLGRGAEAEQVLAAAVAAAGAPDRPGLERDLQLVARGALVALRGLAATGAERLEYRELMAPLAAEARAGGAPASVVSFLELWLEELGGAGRGARRRVPAELADRVGAEAARVFAAGALPAGTLALSLAYSAETGLELVARLEPRLLAVPLPAIPPPAPSPRPPS